MTASELFAQALGKTCDGKEECHWCGGKCGVSWIHDDPGPAPYTKQKTMARKPGSRFVCVGCYNYRMKRVTVFYLMGGYQDKQAAQDHSWLMTPEGAFAIRTEDHGLLWERLLNPPPLFCFSLIEDNRFNKNLIQWAMVNDHPKGVDLDTPLQFTINNVPHIYSVYELESALESREVVGKESGVRELLARLSPYKLPEKEKRGKGRPKFSSNPIMEAKV